ncbi:hypothetical protein GWI33_012356 [Rhynchophorus ferrugineus]|uniref:Uncharacterized protein n=1 Tax=Rhynchophorus ferrugineus TaxID=354439 RepID=A0A834IS57_RHYFE|nr:hypothetical protein GWI33_012356 [Rhynchophorus ferrugineus]
MLKKDPPLLRSTPRTTSPSSFNYNDRLMLFLFNSSFCPPGRFGFTRIKRFPYISACEMIPPDLWEGIIADKKRDSRTWLFLGVEISVTAFRSLKMIKSGITPSTIDMGKI